MLLNLKHVLLSVSLFLPSLVSAQLASGYPLGPLTTSSAKWAKKVCDVTKYGAVADGKTDLGPPLLAAFKACANGGVVNIPLGNFAMSTWVTLSGGKAWAINLEGVIYRTGTAGGHMIIGKSSGAIQGYGYVFHAQGIYGPRLIRLVNVINFSIHDIALVDSPAFHLILDTVQNGQVYNLIIRGGNQGGLDGINVWGFNVHIHDIEVTNKDECVTVKNPSNHMLIENIHCNWSGGCAIGSLGGDTAISKITYNNIYTWQSNQMFMIKSNGGSGSVSDSVFSNFIGHSNAYSLDIDAYWKSTPAAGDGVLFTGLTFSNWKGTCADGTLRAPIQIICPTKQPCTGLGITNFAIWTDKGSRELYKCQNAWGDGGCLVHGSAHTAYAIVTKTVSSAPSGYSAAKMPNDIAAGYALTASIPIPTIPTTFFPGLVPATKRAYP
ncbi:glycoside hydrolase family 28 protein [Sclerotinia borealis F-4128]|uniref:Glycoside hydrolase family 28 protein n=1 Tax=Sclerotinia borealis (strain F-4128) TaxID=1432307 RepID=W9CCS6_SCLBF|nr:glycoside hydrolase family 28 protein [Sclerotinia borealis F-4128]